MTTATTTTPIDHTTTAGFRAWGAEMKAQLSAVGLVNTADTGQINWATVNFTATASTVQGYEIWRFADSTLYIKFEYGTGSNGSGYPGLWVTVGTGSNGSGTITGSGVISTRVLWTTAGTAASTVASYPSYWSRTANHLAILWKTTAVGGTQPLSYLIIGKTVDGTGAATTTGYGVVCNDSSSGPALMYSVRLIATTQVFTGTTKFCTAIGEPTTSTDAAGNFQVYEAYVNVPDVLPFLYGCGVNINDIPRGTTFSVNMVGATAHTYLSMGNMYGLNNHTTANYGLAMLYE